MLTALGQGWIDEEGMASRVRKVSFAEECTGAMSLDVK
jgi:hypothetical protein